MAARSAFLLLLVTWFWLLVPGLTPHVAAQPREASATPFSTDVQPEWLREVLPEAEEFGGTQGEPPAWPGYRTNPVNRERNGSATFF